MLAAALEAGGLITAEEAERRVIILENPGLVGSSRITTSLYAGLQMVLPGEIAPAHRHTQSAIRLALDSHGAYTTVGGERTRMKRGDLVLTPPMVWHDHGNEGKSEMIWLDGRPCSAPSMAPSWLASSGWTVSRLSTNSR